MESFWTSIAGIGRGYSHITCHKNKNLVNQWYKKQLTVLIGFYTNYCIFQSEYRHHFCYLFLGFWSRRCLNQTVLERYTGLESHPKVSVFCQYSPLHSSHRLRFTFCLLDLLAGCCHQSTAGTRAGIQPASWWGTNQEKIQDKNENQRVEGRKNGKGCKTQKKSAVYLT